MLILLIKIGIKVKMITGDHLNIAKETARLIGMGTNILKGIVVVATHMTTTFVLLVTIFIILIMIIFYTNI